MSHDIEFDFRNVSLRRTPYGVHSVSHAGAFAGINRATNQLVDVSSQMNATWAKLYDDTRVC